MPTMATPDDPLKERFARVDERFDGVNRRLDDLSTETRAMRKETSSLHASIHRGNYTLLAAMLGLIAAILAKGV